MLRIMGPVILVAGAIVDVVNVVAVDVVDVVSVEIVIVVDVDVAPTPVTITPVIRPRGSQDNACPHGEAHPRHISGIGVRVIRIGGRTVDNDRVVGRDVNNFRIRLLNNDDLLVPLYLLGFHGLLLARLQ
jgi:hypothetical protein